MREPSYWLWPARKREADLIELQRKADGYADAGENERLALIDLAKALARNFGNDRTICAALVATIATLNAAEGRALAKEVALAASPCSLIDTTMTARLEEFADTLPDDQAYFDSWEIACIAKAGSALQARSLENWRFKSELRLKQGDPNRLQAEFQRCANQAGEAAMPAREPEKTAAYLFGRALVLLPEDEIYSIYVDISVKRNTASHAKVRDGITAAPAQYVSPYLELEAKKIYKNAATIGMPD